jgi:membrane protease subunit HflC
MEAQTAPGSPTRDALRKAALFMVPLLLGATLLLSSLFTVDVTEFGVVTRFGAPVRVVSVAGLHVKAPFDAVVALDRRWTYSRPQPSEYLTVDKRNVVVESVATWRVHDPQRYLASVASRADADVRIGDAMLGEIGAVIGRQPASALIAPDGKPERFEAIAAQIRERVAAYAGSALGIEIAAVQLLHLTLPEQNRVPVFERMKAERGRIAKQYRSTGELLARRIIAEADREKTRIEAQAYARSQRLRAEGDAEAGRIYAAAYGRDAALYKFQRSLKAYEKFLDEQTTLFLPADAEVLRVLRTQPISLRSPASDQTVAATSRSAPRPAAPGAPPAQAAANGATPGLPSQAAPGTRGKAQ